jgi:diketogulonate reductase-like aldo/keto reductase
MGYTQFDSAESYAAGHAEDFLGRAIRASGFIRKDLFAKSKVSPERLARFHSPLHGQ